MSACEKFQQHRGQAQQALLKHLLVTGPSMRLRYYMLDFKRSQKKVSACKKYQQHRGQAQQALLKHLLVTAFFGRNKDRQIAGLPSHVGRTTHGNKKLENKSIFCERM